MHKNLLPRPTWHQRYNDKDHTWNSENGLYFGAEKPHVAGQTEIACCRPGVDGMLFLATTSRGIKFIPIKNVPIQTIYQLKIH